MAEERLRAPADLGSARLPPYRERQEFEHRHGGRRVRDDPGRRGILSPARVSAGAPCQIIKTRKGPEKNGAAPMGKVNDILRATAMAGFSLQPVPGRGPSSGATTPTIGFPQTYQQRRVDDRHKITRMPQEEGPVLVALAPRPRVSPQGVRCPERSTRVPRASYRNLPRPGATCHSEVP